MSGVMHYTVSEADDGQRLDRWVKKYVPDIPYVLAMKLMRTGQVRVDGKRAKPELRLMAGQQIRIPPVEDRERVKPEKKEITPEDAAFMRGLVIYDDGDLVVLNKPSGIASQGGGGVERHIDGLAEALVNKKGLKPRLIHRLDRDTSGILLLARSGEAVRRLGAAFRGRDVKKIYWAIVTPAPEQEEGTIRAPLAKAKGAHKDKMIVEEGEDSKIAITDFVVRERAGKKAAFVAFWPRTGRTHQIRVHAADILGCPILGDGKYGGAAARIEGMALAGRLHLHARRLILKHPMKDSVLDITASLPSELRDSWVSLGFDPDEKTDPFGL